MCVVARSIIGFLVLWVLQGCGDQHGEVDAPMENKVAHASRHSGYSGTPQHWKSFLSCWYGSELTQHREFSAKHPDVPYMPILPQLASEATGKQEEMRVVESIKHLETSLTVFLPKSYKDFLIAYRLASGKKPAVGMYPPNQVGRLGKLDPEFVRLAEQYAIDSNDDDYFVYGTKQDDVARRTSYLRDAIVLGKYGEAMYELIVLYPQVRTTDGEMETALLQHSGEFRAPSFAEAMRQLSFLKTTTAEHMPPYAQRMLIGTCADRLPISNVWWGEDEKGSRGTGSE